MSIFGFSTETGGGDFMPVCKYDARAGRIFRVDRVGGTDGFNNVAIDLTSDFKAVFDFENVEVGWILFTAGSAPHFSLVRMGDALPPRPSDLHKNGVRFIIKLAKSCGGEKPIREMASTAKAFLNGIEAVYRDYELGRAANAGKLPVIALEKTLAVKTGSGQTASTNYQPVFRIVSWAPRGDLVAAPRASVAAPSAQAATPPSTGSTRVEAPAAADADFG